MQVYCPKSHESLTKIVSLHFLSFRDREIPFDYCGHHCMYVCALWYLYRVHVKEFVLCGLFKGICIGNGIHHKLQIVSLDGEWKTLIVDQSETLWLILLVDSCFPLKFIIVFNLFNNDMVYNRHLKWKCTLRKHTNIKTEKLSILLKL